MNDLRRAPKKSDNPFTAHAPVATSTPSPVIDAGVAALGRTMDPLTCQAFRAELAADVKAVLDAVGHPHQTSAEIDRLKAQLASAHETLRAARAELRGLYNDRRKTQTPAAAPDDDPHRAAAGHQCPCHQGGYRYVRP